MGTLSERLADAVAFGSMSVDRMFDVRWSSRSALQSTHSNLINPESLTASPAVGAEIFRDNATLATSL
jgi:hypothetical protein